VDWWETAARSARSAALSATSAANSAARSAALSANSAARSAARSAATWDSKPQGGAFGDLNNRKLWAGAEVPAAVQSAHDTFLTYLADDPNWRFFHDWYLAMWDGMWRDWDLAIEVAKIANDVWNAGLEAVGAEIKRIEARLKTNIGPRLRKNPDNKWEIEPDVVIEQEPIEFAIAQVEVTLTAVLSGNANNGLTETSDETLLIRSACSLHRDNPSVVATSFWNACMSLQRNIGDIYPKDASLLALKNVLYTSVEELCEQSDLIRTRIGKLAALETRRYPTPKERKGLAQVSQAVEEDMTQDALAVLQSDIDIAVDTDKPPRAVRARLVNWLTTIGSGIDKAQKNEKRAYWLLKLAANIAGWFFEDEDDNTAG
jgi:hypothetical protein